MSVPGGLGRGNKYIFTEFVARVERKVFAAVCIVPSGVVLMIPFSARLPADVHHGMNILPRPLLPPRAVDLWTRTAQLGGMLPVVAALPGVE